MGEIVVLKPANSVEFDGPALAMVAELSELARKLSAISAKADALISGPIDNGPAVIAGQVESILDRVIDLMSPIGVAFDTLQENSDYVIEEAGDEPVAYMVNGGAGVLVLGRAAVLCSTIRVQTIHCTKFQEGDPLRLAPPGSLRLHRLKRIA